MIKFSINVLILTSIVIVVSGVFLSDGVKVFRFKKIDDGSEEFEFEFEQDGKQFRGETYQLTDLFYFMFGPDNTTYWVQFTPEEFASSEPFSKSVLRVERNGDEVHFKDDFMEYFLTPFTGDMTIPLYATEWNLKNICFKRSDDSESTFDFVISSDNNSRKFIGTTQRITNDPHLQRIHLLDNPQHDGLYEVKFTKSELLSSGIFCKGISKVIEQKGALETSFAKVTNFELLMLLNGDMNKIWMDNVA